MTTSLFEPGQEVFGEETAALPGSVTIEVVRPGIQTTVQDLAGRSGRWDVGVPPSGAFDDFSFAIAGLVVGNNSGDAGLECVMVGPVLRFSGESVICVAGAAVAATVDGLPVVPGVATVVPDGAVLDMGKLAGPGMRGYLAVRGGLGVPVVLGSRSTFILGKFGGFSGRPLRRGDILQRNDSATVLPVHRAALPVLTSSWKIRVMLGPHGAPVHLTPEGADALFGGEWTVDHRSDRTGVRLLGPIPLWARPDGGEAGLHPSNVHDSAYPVGGIMLSGDTPVIVGPDGPSLGGFVVPCVVIGADRWMLGQLRPGDQVELVPVSLDVADAAIAARRAFLAGIGRAVPAVHIDPGRVDVDPGSGPNLKTALPAPLAALPAAGHRPDLTVRLAGDRHVLVEAGNVEFDLTVRMWIHLLAGALRADRPRGVVEIVEGVRSLLVAVDDTVLRPTVLAGLLAEMAGRVVDPTEVVLDVREVALPIAFDHPLAHEAMERYQRSVNPDAPWCPDNVEFIRRMNDLPVRDTVFDIVTAATYLVVGLGDVYLGAPVAVPIDPRHRLVTTKYNPARTWTPQNAVGIGGIYLCVYGMEGPGGYQLVGRTVPVWRLLPDEPERDPQPWLLRQFDRLHFTPVSAEELEDTRADILSGRTDLHTRAAQFSLAEVARIESEHATEIAALRGTRQAAFQAERNRWNA
ncbi:urea carboxylase [Nakamurella sp. UYEF19]|uniref:5-oxoprolinase/urea amidolyase family protein n=1 Tax=Nakamurella sp. UYEF19 TaxID=1756392 RepID=UPI003399C036